MKIIMAWEVGRNLGHVTKIANLAKALLKANKKADITLVLRETGAALPYLTNTPFTVLQAPLHAEKITSQEDRLTILYCDDLKTCGYTNPTALAGLIKSWQGMYDLIKPDLLITQAAPTALLAARPYKFKTVNFGGGYDVPVRSTPMPPLTYWEDFDSKQLKEREKLIVDNINDALKLMKQTKIKNFSDAIESDREYLTTFEELDHYRDRESRTKTKPIYCGANYTLDKGEKVVWKPKSTKRIFGYLQFNSAVFKPTIEACMGLPKDYDVIMVARHIPEKHKEEIQKKAPHIRLFDQPINLSSVLKDCDLGISHASSGVGAAIAAHGSPQLVLPLHLEQFMFARALGKHKLARGVMGKFGPKEVRNLINLLLSEPEYQEAVKEFAKKYSTHTPLKTNKALAEDILTLVKKK